MGPQFPKKVRPTRYKHYKSPYHVPGCRTGSGTSSAGIPLKPKEGLTPISCHAVLERSRVRLSLRKGAWRVSTPQASAGNRGEWATQHLLRVLRQDGAEMLILIPTIVRFSGCVETEGKKTSLVTMAALCFFIIAQGIDYRCGRFTLTQSAAHFSGVPRALGDKTYSLLRALAASIVAARFAGRMAAAQAASARAAIAAVKTPGSLPVTSNSCDCT